MNDATAFQAVGFSTCWTTSKQQQKSTNGKGSRWDVPDRCGWVEPGLVMRTVGRHLRRGGPNEKRKIRKGFRTERLENPQLWRGISWGYLGDMYYIYIYMGMMVCLNLMHFCKQKSWWKWWKRMDFQQQPRQVILKFLICTEDWQGNPGIRMRYEEAKHSCIYHIQMLMYVYKYKYIILNIYVHVCVTAGISNLQNGKIVLCSPVVCNTGVCTCQWKNPQR